MDIREIVCKSCKESVPIDNVRYTHGQKDLVCRPCFDKYQEINQIHGNPASANVRVERINYICGRCRYKFSRKKNSRINLACPYCDHKEILPDKGSATEIIDEVSQRADDFYLM